MKLTTIKTPPADLFFFAAKYGTHRVFLACRADGAIALSAFLVGETAAQILARWRQAYPASTFNKPANNFKPDITHGLVWGTSLQLATWRNLVKVKPGTALSYQALARKAGHSKAVRAVASAVAKNRLAPFIPCHRIVPSTAAINGKLGNYSGGKGAKGGTALKAALLYNEAQ